MTLTVVLAALLLLCLPSAEGQCGYAALTSYPFRPTSRILNSPESPQCAWPWVVAIRENVFPFPKMCSGVLVGKTKVITTASCIQRFRTQAPPALVILGEHDITEDFQSFLGIFNETYRLVRSTTIHPDYSGKANDIAVIRLSEDVQYTPCIVPACLPTNEVSNNFRVEEKCAYTGWGITTERSLFRSAKLREAFGMYFSQDLCSLLFSIANGTENPQNSVCVEPNVVDQRACSGDEGGMVACDEGEQTWIVESLINQPSCSERTPTRGVDLRAPSILDFINNN